MILTAVDAAAITTPVFTIREVTAAGPQANARTGIQATVDAFRADLGGPDNAAVTGGDRPGRREVNWDGVSDPDAAPGRFVPDFFNAVSPRGAIFAGVVNDQQQFQVSADAANAAAVAIEFGHLNATYPTAFATFSSERLFIPTRESIFEVRFYIPGTLTPAAVSGFGAVFTDVDTAGLTSIRYFDTDGIEISGATSSPPQATKASPSSG